MMEGHAFVRIDDLFGGMTDHHVAGNRIEARKLPQYRGYGFVGVHPTRIKYITQGR